MMQVKIQNNNMKEFIMKNKSLIGLMIFSIMVSFLNPNFLTVPNILNVFRQTSINSVIAVGMTFVILTAGIDLSVGSILAIAGSIAASLLFSGANIFLAVGAALAVGTIIGIVNGACIGYMKLQPFIMTLVTMTFLRGATLVFSDGKPISAGSSSDSRVFEEIGSGYILGIPIPIYIMAFVFLIAYYILKHTKIGRYVYALGGNEEATKLSGINVNKIKIISYGISGFLAALAGIILTSRLASAQPTAGAGYELDAIAAVVLGGTSLSGGKGTIGGTLTGALIIGVLSNALNLLNVSSYSQMMVKAAVILAAIIIDRKSQK